MNFKVGIRQTRKNILLTGTIVLITALFSTLLINWHFTSKTACIRFQNGHIIPSYSETDAYIDINWKNFLNQTVPIDLGNSTMVFNSIFAALKQSASDIHPLGLTYFPATVRKGTLLYHTTPKSEIPDSFEWIALDHEFSYFFGVRFTQYGRNSTVISHKYKSKPKVLDNSPSPKRKHEDRYHFLTFETSRDLQLIYLDGASAAKTETGEMDTQKLLNDIIELDMSDDEKKQAREKYPIEERLYADRICRWGKPLGLDGYVRVEIGFEVILCDFLNGSVELISNITIPRPNDILGIPPVVNKTKENGWSIASDGSLVEENLTSDQVSLLDREDDWQRIFKQYSSMEGFDWIRAGNIHDKGENRIFLDYHYMITGINRTEMNPDPNGRRLLNQEMNKTLQKEMVNKLATVVKTYQFGQTRNTNWQSHIEQLTDKFAPMLKIIQRILNNDTGKDLSSDDIALQVTRYTFNFILRFRNIDPDDQLALLQAKDLAIYQYVKPIGPISTKTDLFIWSAIVRVVTEIIDGLYAIHTDLFPIVQNNLQSTFDLDSFTERQKFEKVLKAKQQINSLVSQLHWIPLEYECEKKCEFDEVCYTPSWGPSPLSWNSPLPRDNGTEHINFGVHYDHKLGRIVINNKLKCINVDLILQK